VRIFGVLTTAAVILYLFAASFPTHIVQAPTGQEFMRCDPSDLFRKDLVVGDTFEVNVTVGNMVHMTTLACSIRWDPYYLNLTSLAEGGCLPEGGFLMIGEWNSTGGYVVDATYGVIGTYCNISLGTAFMLTFKIMHAGWSTVDIYDMSCWDFDLNEVLSGDSPYDCRVRISEIHTFRIDINNDTITFYVQIETNSTITTDLGFILDYGVIMFNVSGQTGSAGYSNVTIPKALLDPQPPWWGFWVMIDGMNATFPTPTQNSTHWFVYIPYTHSEHEIYIVVPVPEFRLFFILPFLTMSTLLFFIVYRKKQMPLLRHSKKSVRKS
jgi:hypothetical protein